MVAQSNPATRVVRQFRVTHLQTGETWLVNGISYVYHGAKVGYDVEGAARTVGMRYPSDCDVHIVPVGRERLLPFDTIPMRIVRPRTSRVA